MYLIDTNILIQSQNTYYGIDICPGFWDWITIAHGQGTLSSIREVFDEFTPDNEDCIAWRDENHEIFKTDHDEKDLAEAYRAITDWAEGQSFTQPAKDDFYGKTDFLLIAHCLAGKHTMVTFEISNPASKKSIKIPDVCNGVGVPCVSFYQVLRAGSAKFQLAA